MIGLLKDQEIRVAFNLSFNICVLLIKDSSCVFCTKAESLICATREEPNEAGVRGPELETDRLVRTKRETRIDDGELTACMS